MVSVPIAKVLENFHHNSSRMNHCHLKKTKLPNKKKNQRNIAMCKLEMDNSNKIRISIFFDFKYLVFFYEQHFIFCY